MYDTVSPALRELLQRAGSLSPETAFAAQKQLAKALTLPLQKGMLHGNILGNIFQRVRFQPGQMVEFPLDLLAPGTEKLISAYTSPSQGRIPEKNFQGDYVAVPTYELAASVDTALKYLRDGRWDIMGRLMQILEAMFVRKLNTDGWHVLLAAAAGRGLVTYDSLATAGFFTKRLVSLAQTVMRRYAGGNSTSLNRGRLTDLYLSPEGLEDIRNWDLTQIDDVTRREIYLKAGDDNQEPITRLFGTYLHDLDELGVGQEFQLYFTGDLSGSLPGGKLELAIGLDQSKDDSFLMPVRQDVEVYEDPYLHRSRRWGAYATAEVGFVTLDSRRTLCLAF